MKAVFLIIALVNAMVAQTQPFPKSQELKMLALGDSYTIGESVDEHQRWPEQLVKELNSRGYRFDRPRIIATTGWRTDDLSRAIDQAKISETYDLVTLLIGVNNQYQGKGADGYRSEFRNLLKQAIGFASGRPENVIVLSIPDYGFTPFGKNKQETISRELNEFNAINRKISETLGCHYVDITPISRRGMSEATLLAPDGLHPSGEMYRLWVGEILKTLGMDAGQRVR